MSYDQNECRATTLLDAQADQMAADVILVFSCDSWGEAIFGPRGII